MNVASENVDELASRLARLTDEDVETALERALSARPSRVAATVPVNRKTGMRKFFDRVYRIPVRDSRSADQIIGYGPAGLPV